MALSRYDTSIFFDAFRRNDTERPALGMFEPSLMKDEYAARMRSVETLLISISNALPVDDGRCEENVAAWGECFQIAYTKVVKAHKDAHAHGLDEVIGIPNLNYYYLRASLVLDVYGSPSWLAWGADLMPERKSLFQDVIELVCALDEIRRISNETWDRSEDDLVEKLVERIPSFDLTELQETLVRLRTRNTLPSLPNDLANGNASIEALNGSDVSYSPFSNPFDLPSLPGSPLLRRHTIDFHENPFFRSLSKSPESVADSFFSTQSLHVHPLPSSLTFSSSGSSVSSFVWEGDNEMSDSVSTTESSIPDLVYPPEEQSHIEAASDIRLRQLCAKDLHSAFSPITQSLTCGPCASPFLCNVYILGEDRHVSAFCTYCFATTQICIGRCVQLHEERVSFHRQMISEVFGGFGQPFVEWFTNFEAKKDVLNRIKADVELIRDITTSSLHEQTGQDANNDLFTSAFCSERLVACERYLAFLDNIIMAHVSIPPSWNGGQAIAEEVDTYYGTAANIDPEGSDLPVLTNVSDSSDIPPDFSPTRLSANWFEGSLVESSGPIASPLPLVHDF
ncbi:hypothetical protein DL96DRAFT_1719840 [Flagelloscypha sp. PMI_526]|nr:hypothetical protein DL96DRAFT_1719840 [Flagelloscypha sp. PMI_526]